MDDYDDENLINEEENEDHAINLKFTIGYSSNMIGAIHNLTLGENKEIFFPSAHTGVIYNYETREQKLLQGHVLFIFNLASAIKLPLVLLYTIKKWTRDGLLPRIVERIQ